MSERPLRRMSFRSLAALSVLFLFAAFLLACGGGGPRRDPGKLFPAGEPRLPPPPDNGVVPPPDEPQPEDQISSYLNDQADLLNAWPSTTLGALSGSVSIAGYTLIDPQSLEPVSPEQGLTDVPLRVVDPEDDIDSITFPDVQGQFLFPDLPPAAQATLNVRFIVAEDVDGDGHGIDLVECKLPVKVVTSRVTTVQLDISPLEPLRYEHLDPPSDVLNAPPVALTYHYRGPDGSRKRSLAILRPLSRVWLDSDLDGEFSPDDLQFADENANGLGDEAEDHLTGSLGPPVRERVVFGAVLSVIGNVVTIFSFEDAVSVEIAVNEGTSLVAEDGEELPLARDLVGRDAIAVAQEYADGHIAGCLIMVLSEPPSQGPDGG